MSIYFEGASMTWWRMSRQYENKPLKIVHMVTSLKEIETPRMETSQQLSSLQGYKMMQWTQFRNLLFNRQHAKDVLPDKPFVRRNYAIRVRSWANLKNYLVAPKTRRETAEKNKFCYHFWKQAIAGITTM